MYTPTYFSIWEMVPPEMGSLIQRKGEHWAWNTLFDERLLRTMDMLRSMFGVMEANTWNSGGSCRYRGFRPHDCDVGAGFSQHRFGRAVDLMPLQSGIDHIRKTILDKSDSARFKDIGGIELDVSWLHIDVRGRRYKDKIATFTP
jgi:hypothetical protein